MELAEAMEGCTWMHLGHEGGGSGHLTVTKYNTKPWDGAFAFCADVRRERGSQRRGDIRGECLSPQLPGPISGR